MVRALLPLLAFACAEAPLDAQNLPVDQAPMPLALTVSDAVLGGTMTLEVSGGGANEDVVVVRTVDGLGNGPCLPQLGGECFNVINPELHTQFTLNASGERTRVSNVPEIRAIAGLTICFQATVLRSGAAASMSNTACILADFDTDGDGLLDANDLCPTGDNFFDWDQDGTPDGCDNANGQPPEWDTIAPNANWQRGTFQNRSYRTYIPPNPVGVVFMFHGSNGDADFVDAPETTETINTWVDRGLGFVAFDSSNRGAGTWDNSSAAASNGDWNRLDDYRDSLIASGAISNNTPIYMEGYSAGGMMVSWFTHASNWPLRAVAYNHSTGRSGRFGATGDVPTLWLRAPFDDAVDPSTMQTQLTNHLSSGYTGQLLDQQERRIAPTSFARSPNIRVNQSITNWRVMVEAGYYDVGGNRTFTPNDVEATIDDIVALPNFTLDAPSRGVLRSHIGTHQYNGSAAQEIADFFLTY